MTSIPAAKNMPAKGASANDRIFGYARVSSKDQCEDRQLISLRNFPVADNNIFLDKQSGKDFQRPQYKKLISLLRPHDLLVVMSIDRLGRNYDEILEQWRIITKQKQADIVVLDMPLLDTRQKAKDLIGVFVADLVLQILSYVAQTERESIKKRQAEGIAAAKLRGVQFGAPRKPIPEGFSEQYELWRAGSISGRAAARALGTSPQTFFSWCSGRDIDQS